MIGRIPPQSLDAESTVIGGLMLEPLAFDEVFTFIDEGDFFKPSHQKIFRAIKELNKKGEPTDLVTLSSYLNQNKLIDHIGGPQYLTELLNQTPSAANIQSHAKIIRNKALLRDLISKGEKIIDRAYHQKFDDVDDFFDSVEFDIFSITERKDSQEIIPVQDLMRQSLSRLETLYKAKKGEVIGLASGFAQLDRLTAGFQPGELTIIAARPSMGKTAFSLNIALHAAIREKKKVAYFSLEMPREQLMLRLLSCEGQLYLSHLRVGSIDEKEWPKLIDTAALIGDSPLFVDDSSFINPLEIRSKARRIKAKHGLDLIIVDYLQLMVLKQRVDSREREVSEISRLLKSIAKELGIPVISLAQLNRSVEGRADRRPLLSDLRESGSIEQDADVILMIYREDYYDRENPGVKGQAEIIVAKQRNGPIGNVKLRWMPEYGLFFSDIEEFLGPTPPDDDEQSPLAFKGEENIDSSQHLEKRRKKGELKNYARIEDNEL